MEQLRSIVMVLMNTVESMSAKITALEKENQELKDTIHLLKGEQGRPKITGSGKKPNKDISSQGKEKEKQPEQPPIPIDRHMPLLTPTAEELSRLIAPQ